MNIQVSLHVTYRNFTYFSLLDAQILSQAKKLDEFHNHLMRCRIGFDMPHKHHQEKFYNIKIVMTVPGNKIVIARNLNEIIFVARKDT